MHLSELMVLGLRDVCSICNVPSFRLPLLLQVIAPFPEEAKLVLLPVSLPSDSCASLDK